MKERPKYIKEKNVTMFYGFELGSILTTRHELKMCHIKDDGLTLNPFPK
jgi:hypothetical protein